MANPANPSGGSDPAADAAAKANNALWYTFQGVGRAYLVRRGSAAATDADASGVHGYPTIEQAQANANTVNAAAQLTITQWNEYASLPAGGGTLGVVETVNITAPAGGKAAQYSTPQNPTTAAASQELPGLAAIGDAATRLTEQSTWIRLAKIVIGGALLIIGLSHITGADNAVANAARRAPLPV